MNQKFLFVGNASYRNRGCEAIVRGTMEILRECISPDLQVAAGVYCDTAEIALQGVNESDPSITNFRLLSNSKRWSRGWWEMQLNQRLPLGLPAQHAPLAGHLKGSQAVLEIGGDNYSVDYGIPRHLLAMDRFLQSRGLPVVIWGASIGPFTAEPEFEREMFSHLRSLRAVFVRESETYKYLQRNGVEDNLHQVADPAFVMKPVEPVAGKIGFDIPPGCIGLNFSPLVGKSFLKSPKQVWKLTEEDLIPWFDFCVACVLKLSSATQRPILLVPHVSSSLPGIDDFAFLKRLCMAAAPETVCPVFCLADNLNAAESKWVISQCSVFAGARTHATIAAFSSHVPTLSFGYSVKAKGINRDIYGSLDYCLDVNNISVSQVVDAVQRLLKQQASLRLLLSEKMPSVKEAALSAGRVLSDILAQ